jgi:hypothetical protein
MINKLTAARLVPRAIAGATVSAYEAAIRSITDLERIAVRTTTPEPLGVLAAAPADLTREPPRLNQGRCPCVISHVPHGVPQSVDATRRHSG